jgi:hypothetical protein
MKQELRNKTGSGRPKLKDEEKKVVKSITLSPQAVWMLEHYIEMYPDDWEGGKSKKYTVSSLIERLIRNHL